MTELCHSEKLKTKKFHSEEGTDTVSDASGRERQLALVHNRDFDLDLTEFSNPVPTASQRRLMTMLRSLQDLEARNAELERALQDKDYPTIDEHIAEHQNHGHVANAIARHSVLELHKQLLAATRVLEWSRA